MSNLIDYEKLWYQSNKDLAAKDAEIERLKTGLGVAGEFIKRNDLLQSQITTLEAQVKELKDELQQVLSIGVEMQREVNRKLSVKHDNLKQALDVAREALDKVDEHWFDGHIEENKSIACCCCDMGEASRITYPDKHDDGCAVSLSHQAIQKINTLTGEGWMSDVTPTRKQYPEWTDFDVDSIMYGLGAPFVGMGVYTLDKKFSWPDPECTSEKEYRDWESHLLKQGYKIPEKYKDAFFGSANKYKGEG